MVKKKSNIRPLTHKEEQVIKKQIEKAAAFTPAEVRDAIGAQPLGAMAMTVAVNLNYDHFVDVFEKKMVAMIKSLKKPEELEAWRHSYREAMKNSFQREMAVYWYTMGATHHDEIVQSVINLKENETNEGTVGQ